MCLIKTHKKPKLFIFPKTVYKILVYHNIKLETPYRETIVELGKTYTGQFYGNRTIFDTVEDVVIKDGFIHSFVSLKMARAEKRIWASIGACIVKCRIPAFTHYYKGDNKDIASRKLKYIKIID